MLVAVNDFVKRQVVSSGKTYSKTLSFDQIADHARAQMEKKMYKEGYRDGVRIVMVDESLSNDFVCPFIKLDDKTKLVSKLVRRREEEEPYIQTRALNGHPVETGKVELILYRHDVLVENNENTTSEEWELISINAIPKGLESLPMGPVTMMRNQLNLNGGTKAFYNSSEWAESVRFWQKYAPLDPDINNT
tara:strand:- start:1459 stop:2031 length:573 start_codon:yes stop_codon:yes gene_type:complete